MMVPFIPSLRAGKSLLTTQWRDEALAAGRTVVAFGRREDGTVHTCRIIPFKRRMP